jgi:RNA polymerase sigma factor for flagellar operon FliA
VNPPLENSQALSITEILPIVDAVVAQMSRYLPQHVSSQDLASAGKLALLEVLDDFKGSFAKDRGYVVCRVRGAILDEMRRLDPLSRHARAQVRRVRDAFSRLEAEFGRPPADAEVAAATGMSSAEVRKIGQLGTAAEALSTDFLDNGNETIRMIADPHAPSPADQAEESDSTSIIRDALLRLGPSQSAVLLSYYFRDLTLQEIAAEMGLSVVRVHQIKVVAEATLRESGDLLDVWASPRL